MKIIGLVGGITWQSTIMYYDVLNRLAAAHDSDIASARCLIHSLEFGQIAKLQKEGRWDLLDDIMADAAKSLQSGGASMIIICANTMHLCIDAMKNVVDIPIIHIAEITANAIEKIGIKKVVLLGTKYTMEQPFFKDILLERGIEAIIPSDEDRSEIHRVIYEELANGTLLDTSKSSYLQVIKKLQGQGAEGVILGCTEIPLLIKEDDVDIPTFDTTTLHASAAFSRAI